MILKLLDYYIVKWLLPQAAEAVIKESVEPLLEEYRPPGITSLKFSKFSLGTVAPKIEGCKANIIHHLCAFSFERCLETFEGFAVVVLL